MTQADGNLVGQLELGATAAGKVRAKTVRTTELPTSTGEAEDGQSEGIVVDRETGDLYVALEGEAGILKLDADPKAGGDYTVVASVEEPYLKPGLEGLTIYCGEDGEGYLIASSQGDNGFAVFERLTAPDLPAG